MGTWPQQPIRILPWDRKLNSWKNHWGLVQGVKKKSSQLMLQQLRLLLPGNSNRQGKLGKENQVPCLQTSAFPALSSAPYWQNLRGRQLPFRAKGTLSLQFQLCITEQSLEGWFGAEMQSYTQRRMYTSILPLTYMVFQMVVEMCRCSRVFWTYRYKRDGQ